MATIYKLNRKKDDSPYYYAKYKTANGDYAYKSTGLTKKREAKNLANEWEVEELKLAKKESKRRSASAEEQREIVNKLIAEQNKQGWKPHITIKAIKKIHSLCAKEDLEVQTLRGYLAEWIIQQKLVVKISIKPNSIIPKKANQKRHRQLSKNFGNDSPPNFV